MAHLGSLTDCIQIVKGRKRDVKFPLVNYEESEESKIRQLLFEDHWKSVQRRIDSILFELNQESCKTILDFVDCDAKVSFREIPTGLIIGSINTCDHNIIYDYLVNSIREKYPVAVLRSNSIKQVLVDLIEQLMGDESSLDIEDQPLLNDLLHIDAKVGKIANCDIEKLVNWVKKSVPKKLIVVIQNFETFDKDALSRLALILSNRRSELPVTLLVGVAGGIDNLHQSLPGSILSLLSVKKFRLENATKSINSLTKNILIDSSSLRIGLKPFAEMLDNFHLNNLSVDKFIKSIHLCYMTHFFAEPLSIFLDKDSVNLESVFTLNHARAIRKLPSFKEHIISISETEQQMARDLLTNDSTLFAWTKTAIQKLDIYHSNYSTAMQILLLTQEIFPINSLQYPLRTLYKAGLGSNLGQHDAIKTLLLLTRKLEPLVLLNHLEKCVNILQESKEDGLKNDMLAKFQSEYDSLKEFFDEEDLDPETIDEDESTYVLKQGLKRVRKEMNYARSKSARTDILHVDACMNQEDDLSRQTTNIIALFSNFFV